MRFIIEGPIRYQFLSGMPHLATSWRIFSKSTDRRRQLGLATGANYQAGLAVLDKILGATDPVGHDHGETASHGLVHH
jgi:hypothetical protein